MKMKKSLLMVVMLLAVSSVMAAMSFSSASVKSNMSVSLVDTGDALLALNASDVHNASYLDTTSADVLEIDLNKGNGDADEDTKGSYGVQESSIYTWNDLFGVTNNSEHAVDVTVTIPDVESNVRIYASVDGVNWERLVSHVSPNAGELTFSLEAGDSQKIDLKTNAHNGHTTLEGLDLQVEAQKQ